MWIEYAKVSFLMMRAKPVRSLLSLLGIFIGVLALVVILTIRAGMRRQLTEAYQLKGVRVVFVHPGFDPVSKRLGRIGPEDIARLRRVQGIKAVWPRLSTELDVRTAATSAKVNVLGIDDQFVPVYRIPMVRGRTFLAQEVVRGDAVCLLTVGGVEKFFPRSEPLGATIDIQGRPNRVIGVVLWTFDAQQRTGAMDCDLLVPITQLGESPGGFISMLEVRLDERMAPERALALVTHTLTYGDPSRQTLFFVRSMDQIAEKRKEFDDRTMMALLGIAAISLLVGGIGIANVMITSVTERTREVGIRKALGARRHDILFQFLLESSLLCATGGSLAVFLGVTGITVAQTFFRFAIPMEIPPLELIACVLLTMFIGLLAGVYPASRAAAMPPVEALRYE